MDSYLYDLDPYRQTSSSYHPSRYPPSYGLERRSSYGLPPADPLSSYARVPLDPYSVYGAAPAAFQSEVVLQPRYVPARTSPAFHSPHPRSRPAPRKRVSPPLKLGPQKKLFKQTQKVSFAEGKQRFSKQYAQKKLSQQKRLPSSQSASLAKETQELHKLFRTGAPANTGKKGEGNKPYENGSAKKRKAETQMRKPLLTKGPDSDKKQKGPGPRSKEKRVVLIEIAEMSLPSEDLCKGIRQFLGIPETKVVADYSVAKEGADASVAKEEADASESAAKEDDSKKTEKPSKQEEPQRTLEQEKEIEANSLKFFSSLFEAHKNLRDLYIEKCYSGCFRCLLCHSVGKGSRSKTFTNLVSLVSHTKQCQRMRPEHAGYGRAVSAVLGWDHEKTPKVPQGIKSADQVNKETKQEVDDRSLDQDENEAEINATDGQQKEVSENPPSEDTKEE